MTTHSSAVSHKLGCLCIKSILVTNVTSLTSLIQNPNIHMCAKRQKVNHDLIVKSRQAVKPLFSVNMLLPYFYPDSGNDSLK